jgi:hypothetical protein
MRKKTHPTKALFYLASPYTHPSERVRKRRAVDVTKAAINLLRLGVYVFAPIAYNEPWKRFNVPGDWAFWADFDKCFVDHCEALVVMKLKGWDISVGVTAEIEHAKMRGKKVYYMEPGGEVALFEQLKKEQLV